MDAKFEVQILAILMKKLKVYIDGMVKPCSTRGKKVVALNWKNGTLLHRLIYIIISIAMVLKAVLAMVILKTKNNKYNNSNIINIKNCSSSCSCSIGIKSIKSGKSSNSNWCNSFNKVLIRSYSAKVSEQIGEINRLESRVVVKDYLIKTLSNLSNKIKNNSLNYAEDFLELSKLLNILRGINEKGFINDMNLLNYPLINEVVYSWIMRDKKLLELDNLLYNKEIKGITALLGDKYIPIKDAKEVYRWSFNLVILKLYKLSEEIIFKLAQENEELYNDLLTDYKTLSKELYSRLDLSIRSKLMKKGISITQNIYTGFDTEYQHEKGIYNKLLCVQASICNQSTIQLAVNEPFDFKEINEKTGKTLTNQSYSRLIDWYIIKERVQKEINSIRLLKYGNLDKMVNLLIEELKNYKKEEGNSLMFVNNENSITFIFERSLIKQFYNECDKYKFEDLVKTSNNLSDLEGDLINIKTILEKLSTNIKNNCYKKLNEGKGVRKGERKVERNMNDVLNSINEKIDKFSNNIQKRLINQKINNHVNINNNKRYTRTNNTSYTTELLSITKKINNYMIAHYTPADMSMFEDFEKYKDQFDIVNKSFVTLKKPILIDGVNVILRDSKLIAPAGKKSLEALSQLYKGIQKINVSRTDIENMSLFQKKDPELFKEYALQDSLITLVHGCFMQEFNYVLGGLGIPVTLSSLASSYIRNFWKRKKYSGYQLSHKYLMTNVSKSLTPKGLSVLKEIGIKSTMYIANYRGGRNESFMYGFDKDTYWYDVDLISAYTTAMKILGSPDYSKGAILTSYQFLKMKWDEMVNSYTILSVNFEFPEGVKYPSIPCDVEEGTICYPLKGSALITSLDYLTAKKQGAKIFIKEGYTVPFKSYIKKENNKETVIYEKPFKDCIEEIQLLRSKYPKGTISNALWKEIGNSMYGLVVRGINEKLKFDARSGDMKRMEGNDLSNPLIAGWITSFIRSVIGELLHGVQLLDGKVVSVTTDGFISNIENLEDKFSKLKSVSKSLYKEYRKARDDKDILEVKNKGWGIMSWSTRGQLSVDSKILAATGFQRSNLTLEEIYEMFLNKIKGNKEINFIQKQLRSGKDIFKKGGNVTDILSDRTFRLFYDNKRFIIEDINKTLLESKPLNTVQEGDLLRYISKLPKTSFYAKNMSVSKSLVYKNKLDVAIRNFIKALFKNELNLNSNAFECYGDIIKYLKDFDKEFSITENSISQLKRRGDFIKVPRTNDTELFAEYVKFKFEFFNDKDFFK